MANSTASVSGLCAMLGCCFQPPLEPAMADEHAPLASRQASGDVVARGLSYMRRKSVEHHEDAGNGHVLSGYQSPPRWVEDALVEACASCSAQFDLLTRKHHCRGCGLVFCGACSSQTDRVVKFGLLEPVRLCNACAGDARTENAFYETHLPLLEAGELLSKYGLLRKRVVLFRFVRAKNLFQYQKVDPDTRQGRGDVKAIPLDAVTDVRAVAPDKDNADLGFVLLVGDQEHRFDAGSALKRQQWLDAIRGARAVREAMLAAERDKRAKQAERENEEVRRMSESLQRMEERKASFHEDRMRRRAEKRESLRAKYNLASTAAV